MKKTDILHVTGRSRSTSIFGFHSSRKNPPLFSHPDAPGPSYAGVRPTLICRGQTLIWRGLGSQIPMVLRDQSGCLERLGTKAVSLPFCLRSDRHLCRSDGSGPTNPADAVCSGARVERFKDPAAVRDGRTRDPLVPKKGLLKKGDQRV